MNCTLWDSQSLSGDDLRCLTAHVSMEAIAQPQPAASARARSGPSCAEIRNDLHSRVWHCIPFGMSAVVSGVACVGMCMYYIDPSTLSFIATSLKSASAR